MLKLSDIRRQGYSWLFLISAAALLHSMYPAGYMPASFSGGWPVMLCPDGLPTGFLSAGQGHHSGHHQHGDEAQEPQASDTCPIGKAFKCSALPTVFMANAPLVFAHHPHITYNRVSPALRLRPANRARAPPFSPSDPDSV